MKKNDKINIEKALINEIKGSGFRDMKNRFRKISEEMTGENVSSIIEKLPAAAFGGFAKVASNPLPVTDKTLKEFLADDNKEQQTIKVRNKNEKKKEQKD